MSTQGRQFSLYVFILAALAVSARPAVAQSRDLLGQPVPKEFSLSDFWPGVGHLVSTVDDFNGLVAVTHLAGTGTDNRGNILEYRADVRVMQGFYEDRIGLPQRGTFVTSRLDVFSGSGPTRKQIHELHFNSLGPPWREDEDAANYGPSWTAQVQDDRVRGTAFGALLTLDLADAPQNDAFQFLATPEKPAKVTLRVEWRSGSNAYTWASEDPDFDGVYAIAQARIDFSFTSQISATDAAPFTFRSSPDDQRWLFAQVGHERNGVFLR